MLKNDWSATDFFQNLVANNKLAVAEGFTFCKVSGLEGFEEALHAMQQATAFCCVSDIADGYTELNNTPRTRRVKTVFLAMRHAIDDMDARNECMEIMRELFRQLMSVLTLERVKLEQNCIYLDPRISFNEIDQYFFSGCACAYFQVAVDVFTDLRFSEDDWNVRMFYDGDLWLLGQDINKVENAELKLIAYIRNTFNMSLTDAREIVNRPPSMIVDKITIQEYLKYEKELVEIGAYVELRKTT